MLPRCTIPGMCSVLCNSFEVICVTLKALHIAETKKALEKQELILSLVPRKGLEPPRIATPEPKSGASTNFATWAGGGHSSIGRNKKIHEC